MTHDETMQKLATALFDEAKGIFGDADDIHDKFEAAFLSLLNIAEERLAAAEGNTGATIDLNVALHLMLERYRSHELIHRIRYFSQHNPAYDALPYRKKLPHLRLIERNGES